MCRILVIGAGGVGVYFSGRLAQAGAEVTVVARSDYEAVSRAGYAVESIAGDFQFTPAAVLKHASEFEGEADYIILAAKVLPEADAVGLLSPAVRSSKSTIVLIQNGIDIERKVAESFPDNRLLSTVAYIGVSSPAPGRVLQPGRGELKMETIRPESVRRRGVLPRCSRRRRSDASFARTSVSSAGTSCSGICRSTRFRCWPAARRRSR